MLTVLVTGGLGYIGSHISCELMTRGYKVVVVDNLSNAVRSVEDDIRSSASCGELSVFHADIREKEVLSGIFEQTLPIAVIHCAALKSIPESIDRPLEYYDNNVAGSLALFEVMKERDVDKIIFSSSASVYGATNSSPITEHHPRQPTNPYARSKAMVEDVLADIAMSSQWQIAMLRYFNPGGSHDSGHLGERVRGAATNIFPVLGKVCLGELDCVKIYGTDYPTPDGTGVRDYIHIMDLASGHVQCLEYLLSRSDTCCEAYNLGTGRGTSVLELLSAFESATGQRISQVIHDRRPGDVDTCYASADKARDVFGWVANKNLEDMCRSSFRFQKNDTQGKIKEQLSK